MIRLMPWLIIGSLVAIWGANESGYRKGYAAAEAKQLAQSVVDVVSDAELERERIELQVKRDLIAIGLEDEANAEPIVNPVCLPVSRVRRLKLR